MKERFLSERTPLASLQPHTPSHHALKNAKTNCHSHMRAQRQLPPCARTTCTAFKHQPPLLDMQTPTATRSTRFSTPTATLSHSNTNRHSPQARQRPARTKPSEHASSSALQQAAPRPHTATHLNQQPIRARLFYNCRTTQYNSEDFWK